MTLRKKAGQMIGLSAIAAAAGAFALGLPAFAQQEDNQTPEAQPKEGGKQAVAVMMPTEGNSVSGIVYFTEVENGVQVEAHLQGLEPDSKHGFHVHQFGDLTSKDGSAMGGHFNPEGVEHGCPPNTPRHVGDLGNIEADSDGHAHYKRVDEQLAFEGENSILGRGMMVHGGTDDCESQPSGDAGARIAQGLIGVANTSDN